MTQQFDEGVKEVLMTIMSLGASMYEADYVLKQLEKRPEPKQQIVQAVEIADDKIEDSRFDQVAREVISKLSEEEPAKKTAEETKTLDLYTVPNIDKYIYDKLRKGGVSYNGAVGIVANLQAESGLDASIKQGGEGPGRGLAQWEKGGRFDKDRINLVKFAKKRKKDWTDLDTQIDFILYEMRVHPEYKEVKAELNKAKDVKEATLIFLRKYEKAGTPHTNKRLKYAEQLDEKLKQQQAQRKRLTQAV